MTKQMGNLKDRRSVDLLESFVILIKTRHGPRDKVKGSGVANVFKLYLCRGGILWASHSLTCSFLFLELKLMGV